MAFHLNPVLQTGTSLKITKENGASSFCNQAHPQAVFSTDFMVYRTDKETKDVCSSFNNVHTNQMFLLKLMTYFWVCSAQVPGGNAGLWLQTEHFCMKCFKAQHMNGQCFSEIALDTAWNHFPIICPFTRIWCMILIWQSENTESTVHLRNHNCFISFLSQ